MIGCGITEKQSHLLAFIGGFQELHGYSPSYSEMMKGCGYTSKASINRLVASLEERGRIRRTPGCSRSIEILPQSELALAMAAKMILARRNLSEDVRKALEDIVRGAA